MHRMTRAREEAFRVVGEEAKLARARARLELSEVFDRALEQRFTA
jgi:hypothetical protein